MTELFLKPAPGLAIRKPDGGWLNADGERVAPSPYWSRRLRAGDVLPVETPVEPKIEPKPKK